MRNKYLNRINLVRVNIRNDKGEKFISRIKNLEWRGYQVESLRDGRKVVIVKPGGKFAKKKEKHDYVVFVQSKDKKTLWQVSHPDLFDDLYKKFKEDDKSTYKLLKALTKVYKGKEPNDLLAHKSFPNINGEPADFIIKVYKWIWAQEDINYPPPNNKGRSYSFEGWTYDYDNKRLRRGRKGIIHLINKAKKKLGKRRSNKKN